VGALARVAGYSYAIDEEDKREFASLKPRVERAILSIQNILSSFKKPSVKSTSIPASRTTPPVATAPGAPAGGGGAGAPAGGGDVSVVESKLDDINAKVKRLYKGFGECDLKRPLADGRNFANTNPTEEAIKRFVEDHSDKFDLDSMYAEAKNAIKNKICVIYGALKTFHDSKDTARIKTILNLVDEKVGRLIAIMLVIRLAASLYENGSNNREFKEIYNNGALENKYIEYVREPTSLTLQSPIAKGGRLGQYYAARRSFYV
jgi:hypothetical protein